MQLECKLLEHYLSAVTVVLGRLTVYTQTQSLFFLKILLSVCILEKRKFINTLGMSSIYSFIIK